MSDDHFEDKTGTIRMPVDVLKTIEQHRRLEVRMVNKTRTKLQSIMQPLQRERPDIYIKVANLILYGELPNGEVYQQLLEWIAEDKDFLEIYDAELALLSLTGEHK